MKKTAEKARARGGSKAGHETAKKERILYRGRAVPPRRGQCLRFPGMKPVFGLFLITGEWYWEVVFESGIWDF